MVKSSYALFTAFLGEGSVSDMDSDNFIGLSFTSKSSLEISKSDCISIKSFSIDIPNIFSAKEVKPNSLYTLILIAPKYPLLLVSSVPSPQ